MKALKTEPTKKLLGKNRISKKSVQFSEKNQKSYEESLEHLVLLLKQGWAAKHSY